MINHTLMLLYLGLSTFALAFIGGSWSTARGINQLIKTTIIVLALVGCVLTFKFAGLI